MSETAYSFLRIPNRRRRAKVTVNVYTKPLNTTTGLRGETQILTDLIATHDQPNRIEVEVDPGVFIVATDVWIFDRQSGTGEVPPIIEGMEIEAQLPSDSSQQRYSIIQVQIQGGEGNRLFVWTNKVRDGSEA